MEGDITMTLDIKDITTGSRRILVDRRTSTEILLLDRDYWENASRGHFGFMINPDFGKGVYN